MRGKGFTLIEVVIVLGISVLLTSVVLTYSAAGRDQVYLGIQKAQVAQVISKAKSLAVSTYNQPDVPCGYGVWFDYVNRAYEIFRYKVSPCDSVKSAGITIHGTGYSSDTKDKFTLPLNIDFGSGTGQMDVVFFMPPDPQTFIWQGAGSENLGAVYLKTRNGNYTAQVQVNSAGQITF